MDGSPSPSASPAESFVRAVQSAQTLIDACEDNFQAHDWRGLALCGQAVCAGLESVDDEPSGAGQRQENTVADHLAEAASAFRAARQRNSDPGWLRARLQDFGRILARVSDTGLRNQLQEVRQLLEVPSDDSE